MSQSPPLQAYVFTELWLRAFSKPTTKGARLQSLPSIPDDGAQAKRDVCRSMLRSEFHIISALVPIKTIAAVIGMSPATLYGYIRSGAFFMPYRRINKTPMVELDDLIEWYCFGDKIQPLSKQAEAASLDKSKDDGKGWRVRDDAGVALKTSETRSSSLADQAVNEALKELGLQNLARRPKSQRRNN